MNPIVERLCENQQREGAFRKHHLEVATNAENIAFVRDADAAEWKQADGLLHELIKVRLAKPAPCADRDHPKCLRVADTTFINGKQN